MDTTPHTLATLFEQLGMSGDPASIDNFIHTHKPLPETLTLAEAPFWNNAQAAFLSEAIAEDSDWAEMVDELDAMLRSE